MRRSSNTLPVPSLMPCFAVAREMNTTLCACCAVFQVGALLGCSVLELFLLVAARRVEEKGQALFNFEVRCLSDAW